MVTNAPAIIVVPLYVSLNCEPKLTMSPVKVGGIAIFLNAELKNNKTGLQPMSVTPFVFKTSPQWFFTVYSEISMMLEISEYMDLFLWGLPATNGG